MLVEVAVADVPVPVVEAGAVGVPALGKPEVMWLEKLRASMVAGTSRRLSALGKSLLKLETSEVTSPLKLDVTEAISLPTLPATLLGRIFPRSEVKPPDVPATLNAVVLSLR